MKGTSRQPEFSLEPIRHALEPATQPRARHPSVSHTSSFPENGSPSLSYFSQMLPDGKGYSNAHFPQGVALR
jgi:hypothetical protein